ncbi:hypothetical protein KUV26_23225 [Leisingera daeponensis]|uniref:Surface antigen domain-containing protein n=1 Tax=Leisingera daeponensis TaxID=405746 RepID=A0ABS7NMC3_9RHOB|nr:hypothetical protein [Leisingera daeponensis]MBY6142347.1 hypothetical protein [Leisingera daeponensis]
MRFSEILTAAAVAALVAAPAASNPLSRILAKSGLTPQDTNIMREAEQSLLTAAQDGKRANWANPDSGAHGEVQVAGREGDCVLLQHQAFVKDDQTPKEVRRKFCPSEGKWLLSQ